MVLRACLSLTLYYEKPYLIAISRNNSDCVFSYTIIPQMANLCERFLRFAAKILNRLYNEPIN